MVLTLFQIFPAGHLAALLGTSTLPELEGAEQQGVTSDISSAVQGVVDCFGPTDFLLDEAAQDPTSPESELIGAPIGAAEAMEMVKLANPITHITGEEPPFLIIHGDCDDVVQVKHSEGLHAALCAARGASESDESEGGSSDSGYHHIHIESGGGHGKDGAFGPWWPKPSRYNWADAIVDRIDHFLQTRVFIGSAVVIDTGGS
jgi:acetyl esterase/lipase